MSTPTNPPSPETTLRGEFASAVIQAMTRVPYAAHLMPPVRRVNVIRGRVGSSELVLPIADIVTFLDQLAARLEANARAAEMVESELRELRQQRTCIRAFFGTGGEL